MRISLSCSCSFSQREHFIEDENIHESRRELELLLVFLIRKLFFFFVPKASWVHQDMIYRHKPAVKSCGQAVFELNISLMFL